MPERAPLVHAPSTCLAGKVVRTADQEADAGSPLLEDVQREELRVLTLLEVQILDEIISVVCGDSGVSGTWCMASWQMISGVKLRTGMKQRKGGHIVTQNTGSLGKEGEFG